MSGHLLSDIEEFLMETGMGSFRFGIKAANNGRLIEQLRTPRKSGKPSRVWPETEIKIRTFMATERQRRAEKSERAA